MRRYAASYATASATCAACKQKITKGSLHLTASTAKRSKPYHAKHLIELVPVAEVDIEGFTTLRPRDQESLRKMMKARVVVVEAKEVAECSDTELNTEDGFTQVMHFDSWQEFDAARLTNAFVMVSGTGWCGACNAAMPEYERMKTTIPKTVVSVSDDGSDWYAHGLYFKTVPQFYLKEENQWTALGSRVDAIGLDNV